MVELWKFDCDGNMYFCDYGLITKTEDYKLRGYIVRRAVQAHQHRPIPQRGRVECTHRVVRESWAQKFVNDMRHNVKLAKECVGLVKDMFKVRTKSSRRRDAHAYFAAKMVPVAA